MTPLDRVRCPLCGCRDAACGPRTHHIPVDHRTETQTMGELKTYDVTTDSGFKTQMRLNDADAERMGLKRPTRHPDDNGTDHDDDKALVTSRRTSPPVSDKRRTTRD